MHFKRNVTQIGLFFSVCLFCTLFTFTVRAQAEREYYQIKIYHIGNADQEKLIDNYLELAYLPALHRAGIGKVGVFYPDDAERGDGSVDSLIYVLVPFKSLSQFAELDATLAADKKYLEAGKSYLEAPFNNPPYIRFESILLNAFAGMPELEVPELAGSDAIYELRSYEAATEKLHLNKIKMFDDGEIEIFDRLGFNAIFYAKVLAGSKMPNLMYMTSFENMESRNAHWESFGNDPGWKKLLSDPQYNNNFLKADVFLLKAKPYSDI